MCPCQKFFFVLGAFLAFLAFAAGAFGAHFLKNKLTPNDLAVFEVAVRYQMYHALALMLLAWASGFFSSSLVALAGWFFILGTLVFSGSLYILILTGLRYWGAITPIGGIILLIGWLLLIIGSLISKSMS